MSGKHHDKVNLLHRNLSKILIILGQHTDEEVLEDKKRIMDHPSKIRKKKKRKTRHKSSKFSEHELNMRSLKGSELSKEPSTSMPTDKEEVSSLNWELLRGLSHST